MEEEVNKTETRLKNVSSKSNERIAQLETELDGANVALIGKIILSWQLKAKDFLPYCCENSFAFQALL